MVANMVRPIGGLEIISRHSWAAEAQAEVRHRGWQPKSDLGRILKSYLHYLPVEAAAELIEAITRTVVVESALRAWKIGVDGLVTPCGGILSDRDLALVSRKVVTTAGVNWIVSAFANTVEMENMKFHGIGTGAVAEAVGDTLLGTELTTQYSVDNTRATGSTTVGASNNVYRTVGTNTVDATVTIAEHGVFSSATSGAVTLLDRSVLSPTSGLNSGESLQTQYDCTFAAGS